MSLGDTDIDSTPAPESPYSGLLRIAETVRQQSTELTAVKAELAELRTKFNSFKGILEKIDDMTDEVMDNAS